MAAQCAITTFDNPYDPFVQFDEWLQFDNMRGYNTCGYLARVANLPNDLSDEEEKSATETAIDRIIQHDFLNIYKKVYMNVESESK